MAITDLDTKYWPEIPKEKSLYIHKLAVKRVIVGEKHYKGGKNEHELFCENSWIRK
ncbi:MAG: hypothetical protein PHX70_02950 [Clostridium sp.]|nr:hypothetical protein [Clostridium sp.]